MILLIKVAFGGGRRKFLTTNDTDYLDKIKTGDRIDNRNLIKIWEEKIALKGLRPKFLWNLSDFENLKADEYNHVLGIDIL